MIPDVHGAPAEWGLRPVAFTLGGQPVTSYSLLVTLGLLAAIALYWFNTRSRGVGGNGLYIAVAAVVGGILGAKIPIVIANLPAVLERPELALSGRTILGGILGGAFAVWLTKRRMGITQRLGNYLVPSLLLGIFVGRMGCLAAGCCYGIETALPWGVDFGDGVLRHPTQAYEALVVLGMLGYAQATLDRHRPGRLFELFMVAYFGWRFLAEFLRVNPVAALGLTYYQVVALLVMVYYLWRGAFVPGRGGAQ